MRTRSFRLRARRTLSGVAMLLVLAIQTACGGDGDGTVPKGTAAQLVSRGLKSHVAGSLDEAEKLYRAALAKDANNLFAYYNLGLIAQTRNNNTTALEMYTKALAVDGSYTPALFNLAIVKVAVGAKGEAIRIYEKVIRLKPSDAGARLNLGLLYAELGRKDDAAKQLAAAVKIDPTVRDRIPSSLRPTPQPS